MKKRTKIKNRFIPSKDQELKFYLESQFYPPHPKYIVNRVVTMFKAYWRFRISEEILKKYIFTKFVNENGFYRYGFTRYLWLRLPNQKRYLILITTQKL